MILGIGLFFVGLVILLILAILFGAAMDSIEIGLFIVLFIPLIVGIYQIGRFMATEFNWI